MIDVLVIGGGPAGLMAAQSALQQGARVVMVEKKPSLGRKFLMAGKSGLNLTKEEEVERFVSHFDAPPMRDLVREFPPNAVRKWADELGAACFVGSSGKVFPEAMKASPLLRAWVLRFGEAGLDWRVNWEWTGEDAEDLRFSTPDGEVRLEAGAVVYALGGGSWPRLGSDGKWVRAFTHAPLRPANMGFECDWSAWMQPHFGGWLKNIRLKVAGREFDGELGLTHYGVEGGVIYQAGEWIENEGGFVLDLLPRRSNEEIAERWSQRGKMSVQNFLRKLGVNDAGRALFFECAAERDIAQVKSLEVRVKGARPLAEAISTRGGVLWAELRKDLALKRARHIFVAGEMLDWSAPTGGYLLTGCLASGYAAGRGAARHALGVG